jgi:hypothetical protein
VRYALVAGKEDITAHSFNTDQMLFSKHLRIFENRAGNR